MGTMMTPGDGSPGFKALAVELPAERFSTAGWERISLYVPEEKELTIYVNEQPLVKILCTAAKLDYLVIGYLYAEGIITSLHVNGKIESARIITGT